MITRQIVQWACICVAAAVCIAILIVNRRDNGPSLPALAHYGNLPDQFNDALQRARADLRGYDSERVKALARLYQANRLYREARACYQAIAANPGGLTARDHRYLAAIFLDESDLGAAQTELRATLQAEPSYVPARVALADTLFKTGERDEAEKEYAAILKIEPHHPQAALGLARIELQRGNDDGAVTRLRKVLADHPEFTSGASLLAQILSRRGQTEESSALTISSQHMHEPVSPDPWMKALLVDCYDLQRLAIAFEEYRLAGQLDEAMPLLGRLEELDPKGWMPRMMHGWSEREAGHYPEAAEQFQLALAHGGDPEKICPLLAATQLMMGRPADAACMLAKYDAMLPHSVPILLSYSEAAVRLKDDSLARKILAEVLRLEPYLYMPNMSMAQILWNSGDHDAAAQCLQRVVKVFPHDIDSRGLLGQYYLEKSDPWSAIGPLEQAHVQDPAKARLTAMLNSALLAAGSLEAARGDFAKAESFSEKSILLVPDGLRGYALKANICKHLKDFRGAAAVVQKMVSLQPDDPAMRLTLGDLVYQSGDTDGGRQYWQQALKLAPADATELRDLIGRRLAGQITPSTLQ